MQTELDCHLKKKKKKKSKQKMQKKVQYNLVSLVITVKSKYGSYVDSENKIEISFFFLFFLYF